MEIDVDDCYHEQKSYTNTCFRVPTWAMEVLRKHNINRSKLVASVFEVTAYKLLDEDKSNA